MMNAVATSELATEARWGPSTRMSRCLSDHRIRVNSPCTPSDPISNGRGGPRTGCVAAPRANTRRGIPPAVHADGGRRQLAAATRQRRIEDFVGDFAHGREGMEGLWGTMRWGRNCCSQRAPTATLRRCRGRRLPIPPLSGRARAPTDGSPLTRRAKRRLREQWGTIQNG